MPEYKAPGVYVEEVSYRAKSIEGVSTAVAGFVGPTRYGSTGLPPGVITNLNEFEAALGDSQKLVFGSAAVDNYMWHAARAFFQEGGKRLYVSRVFRPWGESEDPGKDAGNRPLHRDGIATGNVDGAGVVSVSARFPGAAGNMCVRFTVRAGQNVLAQGLLERRDADPRQ
jgi:phage tail sheath protein FI